MKRVGGRTDGRTDMLFYLSMDFSFSFSRSTTISSLLVSSRKNEWICESRPVPSRFSLLFWLQWVSKNHLLFVWVPCFFLSLRYTSSFVKLSLWRFVLSLVCSTPLWVNSISSLMLTLTRSRSLSLESLTNASSSRHAFYFFPSFSLFFVSHKSLCRTTTHPLYFFYTPWSVSK